MYQLIKNSLFSLLDTFTSTEARITCYHCGETSKQNLTIYVQFDNDMRPVCCHGCAAILNTIEDLGMHEEYHASKIQIPHVND